MSSVPRQRLAEFLLEVQLTSRKHLVVEGRADERFIRAFLQGADGSRSVTITPVEKLEISMEDLVPLGFPDGNRGRVVVVAVRALQGDVTLLCIADRDCGHRVDEFCIETLLWTDFPAIESYAVTADILEKANLLGFGGRLPDGNILLAALSHALRELFAVRLQNPYLGRPNYAAGLQAKAPALDKFEVRETLSPALRSKVDAYPRPDIDEDPRAYAYGHDVGELLLAAFANALKNQAGLKNLEAVEGALRSAIQAEGSYVNEPLFRKLATWIAT